MNIIDLTKFNLKTTKKQIIGWMIAMFSLMFLYMILFPSVKDMAQVKMEAMPEELMQFMGVDSFAGMGNYDEYFAMIYNLILIAISVFATIFASNIIANEEKNKTLEFLYALKVSRLEIFLSKLLTAFIGVLAVVSSAAIATIICGLINGGETFNLTDTMMMIKGSGQIPFVYMAIGLLLAGITTKLATAGLASIVVIFSYVLGFLSTMVSENLEWIVWFSPFEKLNPKLVVELNSEVMTAMGLYSAIMIIAIVVGGIFYNKRDYNL